MKRILLVLLLLGMPVSAWAQGQTAPPPVGNFWYDNTATPPVWRPNSAAYPAPVAATASISGFTAAAVGTPIAVSTANTTGNLPAGAVVVATNVGTTYGAYCALGASANSSGQYISPGGGWFAFTVGLSTQLSCVGAGGATTVNLVGGAGLPTGTGGGSGAGGGGGGAVTIANGADVALGYTTDTNITNPSSNGTLMAFIKGVASLLTTINTNVSSAVPAGTNSIGSVTVLNSTAPILGTTNGWSSSLLPALVATVTTVKNAAGQVGEIYCYNPNGSVAYVQTFNLTPSSVTLGTTTPQNSFAVGATAIGGQAMSRVGIEFTSAISVAATTTMKGLTAPSTGLDCNVLYN